jgi:hypothetical protein
VEREAAPNSRFVNSTELAEVVLLSFVKFGELKKGWSFSNP